MCLSVLQVQGDSNKDLEGVTDKYAKYTRKDLKTKTLIRAEQFCQSGFSKRRECS